jgi:hypothetical protein
MLVLNPPPVLSTKQSFSTALFIEVLLPFPFFTESTPLLSALIFFSLLLLLEGPWLGLLLVSAFCPCHFVNKVVVSDVFRCCC